MPVYGYSNDDVRAAHDGRLDFATHRYVKPGAGVRCPKCVTPQDDPDGFGFVHCPACGHCKHPDRLGGTCTICGHAEELS